MVDFVSLAATAQRLIEENGRSVTLFRKDRTPANAAEPWRGPDLTAPDPVAGIGPVKVVPTCLVAAHDADLGVKAELLLGALDRAQQSLRVPRPDVSRDGNLPEGRAEPELPMLFAEFHREHQDRDR